MTVRCAYVAMLDCQSLYGTDAVRLRCSCVAVEWPTFVPIVFRGVQKLVPFDALVDVTRARNAPAEGGCSVANTEIARLQWASRQQRP
jgi:hypothetical protein